VISIDGGEGIKILIIKLGAIGDVIRTTSVLVGLKDHYNPRLIDWLTAPAAKEVLLENPLIDNILVYEKHKALGSYDLAIGLEDDLEICQFVSNLRPKEVLGAYAEEGKITYTPSAWFDMSAISQFGLEKANELKKKNQKTYQQHLADLLGVEVGSYIFNLTPEEVEYGKKYVRGLGVSKGERIIGINTGAGKRWQLKALSIEKTIDLVKRIRKELGAVSLILGGEEEKERNGIIAKETGMPDAGIHSLRKFASIINQCQLVVSSDSLAMHFAIGLGKKLVVFFGPTSPAEIELYGLGAKVYPDLDCLVCYKKQCDKQPNCIDNLSVKELFAAVKKELNR